MRILLDTNILLEVILEHQKVQEVKDLLSKTDEYEFFITDFSLHSIGLLLFRRNQHQIFLEFLKDVCIEGGISIARLTIEDMEKVVDFSERFNLDFDDAYQYVIAERYKLAIISFDSDFDRTEKGRKTPAEVLKS
jgi:predicted nucleic acid-binding protein